MNLKQSILSKVALVLIPASLGVAVMAAAPTEAAAQVQVVFEPPAAFVATSEPVYFEGRPHYWYNNQWYYRDHGRWSYYRTEPPFLYQRRMAWGHGPVVRGEVRGPVVRERGYREPVRYRYRR